MAAAVVATSPVVSLFPFPSVVVVAGTAEIETEIATAIGKFAGATAVVAVGPCSFPWIWVVPSMRATSASSSRHGASGSEFTFINFAHHQAVCFGSTRESERQTISNQKTVV